MTYAAKSTLQARTLVNRDELETVLARHYGNAPSIVEYACRPSPYASSHGLFELDIVLNDGSELRLLSKAVGEHGLLEAARRAKPPLLHHPTREVDMYRSMLAPLGEGTPTCYGVLVDQGQRPRSLILERIDGLELRRIGEFRHWQRAVRLLGRLHLRATSRVDRLSEAQVPPLIQYDEEFYWEWPMRVVDNAARDGAPWSPDAEARMIELVRRYGQVVEYLMSLPISVIHGDCFPSNVLLETEAGEGSLYFVDWELAAIGPGLMDVAALTAGDWSEDQRRELLRAYREVIVGFERTAPSLDEMQQALDFCRLHLAMQLLGWSPEWVPPSEQAQDWLGEALRLADKLEL